MSVSFRLDRSVPILSIEGRLDARGAAAFDQAWKTLPPDTSHVVLDLTAVGYLSDQATLDLASLDCVRRGKT
jgi:anti-anti-sigma regulatory factor